MNKTCICGQSWPYRLTFLLEKCSRIGLVLVLMWWIYCRFSTDKHSAIRFHRRLIISSLRSISGDMVLDTRHCRASLHHSCTHASYGGATMMTAAPHAAARYTQVGGSLLQKSQGLCRSDCEAFMHATLQSYW